MRKSSPMGQHKYSNFQLKPNNNCLTNLPWTCGHHTSPFWLQTTTKLSHARDQNETNKPLWWILLADRPKTKTLVTTHAKQHKEQVQVNIQVAKWLSFLVKNMKDSCNMHLPRWRPHHQCAAVIGNHDNESTWPDWNLHKIQTATHIATIIPPIQCDGPDQSPTNHNQHYSNSSTPEPWPLHPLQTLRWSSLQLPKHNPKKQSNQWIWPHKPGNKPHQYHRHNNKITWSQLP